MSVTAQGLTSMRCSLSTIVSSTRTEEMCRFTGNVMSGIVTENILAIFTICVRLKVSCKVRVNKD